MPPNGGRPPATMPTGAKQSAPVTKGIPTVHKLACFWECQQEGLQLPAHTIFGTLITGTGKMTGAVTTFWTSDIKNPTALSQDYP